MPIKHAFVNPKSDGGDATIVRPSDWNADHEGAFAEGVTVTRSSAQSIAQNSNDAISWSTTAHEDASAYWDSGQPTRIVIQRTGWHMYGGGGKWSADTGGRRNLFLRVNGAGAETDYPNFGRSAPSDYNDPHIGMAGIEYLTAGDYVEMCARQNDNAAGINISLLRFSVVFIGSP